MEKMDQSQYYKEFQTNVYTFFLSLYKDNIEQINNMISSCWSKMNIF